MSGDIQDAVLVAPLAMLRLSTQLCLCGSEEKKTDDKKDNQEPEDEGINVKASLQSQMNTTNTEGYQQEYRKGSSRENWFIYIIN